MDRKPLRRPEIGGGEFKPLAALGAVLRLISIAHSWRSGSCSSRSISAPARVR